MNKRARFSFKFVKFIDWLTIVNITAIVLFGIVAIANATASPVTGDEQTVDDFLGLINLNYPLLQIMWYGVGLFAMCIVMFPDYHNIGEFSPWIYWINVALLLLLWVLGDNVNGATAWFRLGERGFQPSEIAKIAIIITLSKLVSDKTRDKEGITKFRDILMIVLSFGLPFAIILLQPDWGTAFVYAAIFFGILFVAKTSFKIIGTIFGVGLAAIPASWFVMSPYQQKRITDFFSPSPESTALSQVTQAKLAIGSGQLSGKGFFAAGALGKLGYVPEAHTDFIFSVTIEPVGFIGGVILIVLYFTLIFRALYLAIRAKDDFGKFIIVGVVCMTLFHVFENIGMNMGIMPVTGIPLPFFSYGGSNMLASMVAFGLVLNVNMRRYRWSF